VRARRSLAFASAALLGLAACQLLVGVEDEPGARRPDASSADAAEAAVETDRCVKHHPPPPPNDTSSVDADVAPLVFAIRTFRGRPRGQPLLGYDLDDRCTGDPTSLSSESPCEPPNRREPLADEDGGIDNALGTAVAGFAALSDAGDPFGAAATKNIDVGKSTNLISVFEYDGQANDGHVVAQIELAAGLLSTGCGDGGTQNGPRWDGCDTWARAPGLIPGRTGVTRQYDGYVTDGVLVIRGEEMNIGLLVGEITIYDAVLTAEVERAEGKTTLKNGIIAGRAAAVDVVSAVQYVDFDHVVVCNNPASFELARTTICRSRDLPLRRYDDGHGVACEAVSFAMGFDAEIALAGEVREMPPPPSCPPRDAGCE